MCLSSRTHTVTPMSQDPLGKRLGPRMSGSREQNTSSFGKRRTHRGLGYKRSSPGLRSWRLLGRQDLGSK